MSNRYTKRPFANRDQRERCRILTLAAAHKPRCTLSHSVADKKISYRALMEVLYTAGQAELGEYKFMVMKNE